METSRGRKNSTMKAMTCISLRRGEDTEDTKTKSWKKKDENRRRVNCFREQWTEEKEEDEEEEERLEGMSGQEGKMASEREQRIEKV